MKQLQILFACLPNFSPAEKWGDVEKMNPILLMLMQAIRSKIGKPITIHCGFEETGHVNKSEHGKGNATDFHVEGLPFRDAVRAVLDEVEELGVSELIGLGVYPNWNNPGFHIDVRGKHARWSQVDGIYVAFEKGLE